MEINTKLYLLTISKIEPYLNDLIDHHKAQGEWKTQLEITINFIASKDSHETRTMYTKSDNIEIILGNETNEFIDELFNAFLQRYQKILQESMRGSFFFYCAGLLYYKFYKIRLNRDGSYIISAN